MQQDYRQKYLKYKNKYIELKSQMGGDNLILNNHICVTNISRNEKIKNRIIRNNTTTEANCFTIKELQPIFNHLDDFELEKKGNIYELYGIKKTKEKEFIANTSNEKFKYKNKYIQCSIKDSKDGHIHINITVHIDNNKEIYFIIYFNEDNKSTIYYDRFKPTITQPKPESHYSTVGPAVPKTGVPNAESAPPLPKPRNSSGLPSEQESQYETPVVHNGIQAANAYENPAFLLAQAAAKPLPPDTGYMTVRAAQEAANLNREDSGRGASFR